MRLLAIAIAICVLGGVVEAKPRGRSRAKPTKKVRKPKQPPKPTPPPSPEKLRADTLFEDGRKYLAAKEYALACTAFEQSHLADPAIGTQLNIALCYEQWGKIVAAYHAFVEARRLAKESSDKREKAANEKVRELAPKVPRLQIAIPTQADVATVFLVDGNELDRGQLAVDQLLEPGRHVIEARVPGKPPVETVVVLAVGDRRAITVEVPIADVKTVVMRRPQRKLRLFGGGTLVTVGAAMIGVASYFSLVARQDYRGAIVNCPDLACEARRDFDATQAARRRATTMTYVGAGGAAVAVIGLYLALTNRGPPVAVEQRVEQRVELRPIVGPDSIGLAVGGRL